MDNANQIVKLPVTWTYLIPEKEIGLTELKLFYIKLLHKWKSHDIEAREDPTSP